MLLAHDWLGHGLSNQYNLDAFISAENPGTQVRLGALARKGLRSPSAGRKAFSAKTVTHYTAHYSGVILTLYYPYSEFIFLPQGNSCHEMAGPILPVYTAIKL